MEHLCLGRGVRKDDANQLFKRMIDADGWLVGVPVYFGSIPAQFKALIDRSMAIQRDINHYQAACLGVGKKSVLKNA